MRTRILAALLSSAILPAAGCGGAGKSPGSPGGWKDLFDGKTLTNWKSTSFGGEGAVRVEDGQIIVEPGVDLSGIHWTGGDIPRMNYEFGVEAMKLEGSDIFCGISFPVGESLCSFVMGGWGGGIVGLSSIDGMNASENETTKVMAFPEKKWHAVRLRVTPDKIEGWINDELVVNVATKDKKISIHPMMEPSQPLGLATYVTRSAFRQVRIRRLP